MKFKNAFKCEGFSQLFVLVGMLLVVVALPIAVKLVQRNQENRSNAATEKIKQDKKCKDVGGICQKKSGSCSGTYLNSYCPSSGGDVKCCVPAKDTAKCLNVGGRCQFTSKTATCSGTIVNSLCKSKTNGSSVVCCVAEDSDSPCTALGGTCVNSTDKTSGGSCTAASGSGFLDLNRSCKEEGQKCCFPSSYEINGKCVDYSGKTLVSLPSALCLSGISTWDGGDMVGSDGKLNWKCKGFNDGATVNCSAKFKAVKDTASCLDVGGRCQEKAVACAGGSFRNDKKDLCSGSNTSSVGCCVVSGSNTPCTAMKGTCVASASATTSGGSCTASNGAGIFDLTFSCGKNSLCCFPSTVQIDGKCIEYSKVLTNAPDNLCYSGKPVWSWSVDKDDDDNDVLAGDKDGKDGTFNWKCTGLSGGDDDECAAKRKVDGACNPDYSGSGKALTSRPADALACSAGKLSNKDSKDGYFTWKCNGRNDGKDVGCKVKYDSCGAKNGECVASKTACTDLKREVINDSGKFCSGSTSVCCKKPGIVDVTSVNLTDTSLVLKIGETKTLSFTIEPATATSKTVTWSSSNTSVLSVSDAGLVKALVGGTSVVTVKTANNKTDTVTINVLKSTTNVIPVTNVTLNKATLSLSTGGREALVATVAPTNATDQSMTWTSDKTTVATVSQTGVVTAVAAGTAKITVKTNNGSKTASATVTVSSSTTNVPVTGITLSPASLELEYGERQAFTATVAPTTATDKTVTWDSDNVAVATVSQTGMVTAVVPGTAKITVKTSNNKTATASVTVLGSLGLLVDPKISFKFAFKGIKPAVSECFDKLGDLKLEVMNRSTNVYESGITATYTALSGETTPAGDQIFEVSNLLLNASKFSGIINTSNYVKVKGPFHLQARMCQNNQSGKLSDTTTCNISLKSNTVYNFSNYPLLSGDIDLDGMVNSIDYGKLKSYFNEEVDCGTNGDLNLDGVVNSVDAGLIKDSLSSRDDE